MNTFFHDPNFDYDSEPEEEEEERDLASEADFDRKDDLENQ